jgi:hypothetical protein
MEIKTFLISKIVLSVTRDNLEIKKVEISMKNPETYQIMRFSSIKS